jgi:hypothetical protein
VTYSVRLQGRTAHVCGLETAGVPAAHAVASLTVALFRFVNNVLSVPLLAFIYNIACLFSSFLGFNNPRTHICLHNKLLLVGKKAVPLHAMEALGGRGL